ncbi:MAG: transcription antitermination factor NusB [Candidatus Paceibacterota bacterium]|jgi:N utilization substance protein B
MSNRHLARSIVLQTIFEWDFRNLSREDALVSLIKNNKEFGEGDPDTSFMDNLLKGVIDKKGELDNIIIKAAPDWPIDKISLVDRNILRIGLYELLFSDRKEVPAKVAINEAIELAKSYSGEKSGGFINGVLGTIYKEIGEPGKDEVSKKKHNRDIPFEKMPIRRLVGAVIYTRRNDEIFFAFVHDVFGRWTLSKGRLENGEDAKLGVKREIKAELGIDIDVEDQLQNNEYVANHPEDGKIRKQVTYFLAKSEMKDLKLGDSGGLDDAKWFKLQDIQNLNFYDDILPIITKAITILGMRSR